MPPLYTTEVFTAHRFLKIMWWVLGVMMLGMACFSVTQLNTSPAFIFITLVFLFLAWSMFAYSRLHLVVSDTSLAFKGGLKPHDIDWASIYKVDMREVGKYDDPQTIIYYNERKLKILRSFYLNRQYKQILQLLEMKLAPEMFTPQYYRLREKIMKQ